MAGLYRFGSTAGQTSLSTDGCRKTAMKQYSVGLLARFGTLSKSAGTTSAGLRRQRSATI